MKLTGLILLLISITSFAQEFDLVARLEKDPALSKKLGLGKLTAEEKAEWNRLLALVYNSGLTNADASRTVTTQAVSSSPLVIWLSKADLESEEIVKLDNGAIFEISGRSVGIGLRREVALIQERTRNSLWIKGKGIYRGLLLRPPQVGRRHTAQRTVINRVSSNGEVVSMGDGSVHKIETMDQIETALWLPGSEAFILDSGQLLTDEGIAAATPVR